MWFVFGVCVCWWRAYPIASISDQIGSSFLIPLLTIHYNTIQYVIDHHTTEYFVKGMVDVLFGSVVFVSNTVDITVKLIIDSG